MVQQVGARRSSWGDEAISGRVFAGRFAVHELLGRSRRSVTCGGTDLRTGEPVVIKAARADLFGVTARARLEYEIAVLNQHQGFSGRAGIHLVSDGDLVVCVRPFLEGVSLADRLERGRLEPGEVVSLGIALLESLARIHPHGVLHRGIKPSNVILDDGHGDSARLVDCGIARFQRIVEPGEAPPLYAAEHLSPEQSGSIDQPVDARSDLYSIGVLLYEALTGEPPFVGETVGEVLRKQLIARPAPLATQVPEIPQVLERIVERLLRTDPRDRYQTARGALADLEELRAALTEGARDPELVVGAEDLRESLTEPAFIGRDRELATFHDALSRARDGDGGVLTVEGESGHGKTRLLAELGRRAMSLGVRVLHGQGLSGVAQRPYHSLEGIVRELVSMRQVEPEWVRDVAARLAPVSGAASAPLPGLAAILPPVPYSSLGPERHGEARTTAALTALLDAMGAPGEPTVIVLDDAQWADEATLRLVATWQEQGPPGGQRHVLIVIAFRPDELGDDHPLRDLEPDYRLRLSKFGTDELRQQIASMAGRLPEAAVQAVEARAGGNPFLVSATLHGMVEVGALRGGAGGWQVNPERLAELQAAEHSAPILAMRLANLSEPARELLSVAALLGRTFDPVLAGELSGLSPQEAMRITEEHRGKLVWADGSGTAFTFVHDRLRDALLEELSPERRRELHLRAAGAVEARDPKRVYELAYHYDAAGQPARALPFALASAEAARKRFALDVAERYYRIALGGAAAASARDQFSIHKGLGDVLALRSRHGEAVEQYRRALALAQDGRSRAEVQQRWSQLEMKRGDMASACAHAEEALRLIGHHVPRSRPVLALWSAWEALVQVLHTNVPRAFVRQRRRSKGADELLAIDIYHGLNGPYFFSRGVMWAGWAHLRLINLAERHPGTRALGRAYAAHAVSLNGFPRLFRRGLRISKAGADLCEQLGDLWGQAQGLTFHAMMLYYLGHFEEAVEVGRRASQLFDRAGDRWEANSGLDFAVDALVRLGDLRGAVRLAQEIWRRGLEIGDSHALAWSLDAWSRATDGQIPSDLVDIARSRARDLQTALAVAQADGVRLIGAGRYAEAVAVLDEARRRNEKEAGYFYELNAPILTYLTTALRKQAEETSPWNPAARRRLVSRARAVNEQALSVARKFRFNLPHALREAALLAAMEGKPRRARQLIDESVAVAEELRERYERAQSRVVRAELGRTLGWSGPSGELAEARRELEALRGGVRSVLEGDRANGEAVTISLVDRFATLLEGGRAIATALSANEVYSEARRVALLLLRGERCVVLERSRKSAAGELVPVHGDMGVICSQDVIRRAFEQGHAVALSAAEALEDAASQRGATRSVLCVPIRVRGRDQACLYLTHGEVGDLFGADEQRIGDFLGTVAGAALENAEGFARLERLSRELEARVQERTEQLARANAELTESLRRVRETHEQLVQSSKMAALGTLVAGLSHELNNPLSVLAGYVQLLLRQTPEDAPTHAALVAMERQAQRCSSLARSLLDFSRAKPATRHPTSPATLCSTVVDLVSAQARERKVALSQKLPDEPLPEIVVSSQEIESVLLNLLSNALDATEADGSIELGVRTEHRDERAGVVFSVADTGKGMTKDELSRVFDPFFTTKPPGRGTGLGLSIAHQAVTAHGGQIHISSAVGRGTTISIWLPVAGDPGTAADAGD